MKLNKRERYLAIGIGAAALLLVGWYAFGAVDSLSPFAELQTQSDAAQGELDKVTKQGVMLEKEKKQLEEWRRRSLPSDPSHVLNDYQGWLLKLASDNFKSSAKKASLGNTTEKKTEALQVFSIPLNAEGTLDELVHFLHQFYSAGHLHLIRRLIIKPPMTPASKDSQASFKELDFSFSIEAVSLTGVDRKEGLTTEKGDRLKSPKIDDYKSIASRNLFSPPSRPKLTQPVKIEIPPDFNPSKYARFTGIVEKDGEPEAWLRSLTDDQKFILHVGDPVSIGPFKAKVTQINPREVEVDINGKTHVIPLGDNLAAGGKTVPVGAPVPNSEVKTPPVPDGKAEALKGKNETPPSIDTTVRDRGKEGKTKRPKGKSRRGE